MPASSSLVTAGTTVAFSDHRGIVVARYPDVAGGKVVGQGQDTSLSPDGTRIAFEDTQGGGAERHFVVCDARTGKRLALHPGTQPHFSPDGTQIAFSRFSGTKWQAFTIDAGLRGKPRPLLVQGFAGEPPAFVSSWNPNGTLIAYSETVGGALYALKANGTVVKKIVVAALPGKPETAIPLGCAWSNDLRYLILEAPTTEMSSMGEGGDPPISGLYLYDLPANRRTLLTPHGLSATHPLWMDSRTILFISTPNRAHPQSSIYAQSVGGGAPQIVVPRASDPAVAAKA